LSAGEVFNLASKATGPLRLPSNLTETEIGGTKMLLLLAIILFIAWILGFVAFHVTVGFIHLLLVLAVIALIWHLVAGRRTVA
jgi:hypothetical protein